MLGLTSTITWRQVLVCPEPDNRPTPAFVPWSLARRVPKEEEIASCHGLTVALPFTRIHTMHRNVPVNGTWITVYFV